MMPVMRMAGFPCLRMPNPPTTPDAPRRIKQTRAHEMLRFCRPVCIHVWELIPSTFNVIRVMTIPYASLDPCDVHL